MINKVLVTFWSDSKTLISEGKAHRHPKHSVSFVSISFKHIPRFMNAEADSLAKSALYSLNIGALSIKLWFVQRKSKIIIKYWPFFFWLQFHKQNKRSILFWLFGLLAVMYVILNFRLIRSCFQTSKPFFWVKRPVNFFLVKQTSKLYSQLRLLFLLLFFW